MNDIETIAYKFANRISSPWGEGAIYRKENDLEVSDSDIKHTKGKTVSHLDDRSFEMFVSDLIKEISEI